MAKLTQLQNDRIKIVPFTEIFITDNYISWLNCSNVVRYSEQRHNHHDRSSCERFLRGFEESPNHFSAIIVSDSSKHIGNISTTVDLANSTVDISIMIGECEAWGKGYGFSSWKLVMDELLRLNFRKVTGGCMAENTAMVSVMKKSGMKPDYIRPKTFLLDGLEVDSVHYAIYNEN